MQFKGILGLLAGYAAGVAMAVKYRKDKKNKDASFMDEVVDIHKSAYTEVRDFIHMNFDGITTWEEFQAKGKEMIDSFMAECDQMKQSLADKTMTKDEMMEKKDEILAKIQETYEHRMELLESGKAKALSLFVDMKEDVIDKWIESAKASLDSAYKKAQSYLDKMS